MEATRAVKLPLSARIRSFIAAVIQPHVFSVHRRCTSVVMFENVCRKVIVVVALMFCCNWAHNARAHDLKVPGWVFFRTSPLKPDESKDQFLPFVIAEVQVNDSAKKLTKTNGDEYAEIEIIVRRVYGESDISIGKHKVTVLVADKFSRWNMLEDTVDYAWYYYCFIMRQPDGSLLLRRRDLRPRFGRF